jgi:hypothetical protein
MMIDLERNEVDVIGAIGKGPSYRYFRVMKFLPDVKELFNKPPEVMKKKSGYETYKRIDVSSYYGYMNDADDIL